jgi:hypothetical protein
MLYKLKYLVIIHGPQQLHVIDHFLVPVYSLSATNGKTPMLV